MLNNDRTTISDRDLAMYSNFCPNRPFAGGGLPRAPQAPWAAAC
jgi:hypothetical protein